MVAPFLDLFRFMDRERDHLSELDFFRFAKPVRMLVEGVTADLEP